MIIVGKVYRLRMGVNGKPMKLVKDMTSSGKVYFAAVDGGKVSPWLDRATRAWFEARIASGPHEPSEFIS